VGKGKGEKGMENHMHPKQDGKAGPWTACLWALEGGNNLLRRAQGKTQLTVNSRAEGLRIREGKIDEDTSRTTSGLAEWLKW
jgi:hypothetical protein